MIKIGITGNIGSGKSTVCRIFNTLQIPVFYADIEARMLYFDDEIKKQVKKTFGMRLINTEEEVDLQALAALIFSNKIALKQLNKIIHPAVIACYQKWLQRNTNAPYTLHEAAVLFENNLQNHFDKTISVSAPRKVRMVRVMQRDGLSAEEVEKRMKHQWSDKKKNALADFVINNDGNHFLIPQIVKIHHQILKTYEQIRP